MSDWIFWNMGIGIYDWIDCYTTISEYNYDNNLVAINSRAYDSFANFVDDLETVEETERERRGER